MVVAIIIAALENTKRYGQALNSLTVHHGSNYCANNSLFLQRSATQHEPQLWASPSARYMYFISVSCASIVKPSIIPLMSLSLSGIAARARKTTAAFFFLISSFLLPTGGFSKAVCSASRTDSASTTDQPSPTAARRS